jgi:hypothetical protein
MNNLTRKDAIAEDNAAGAVRKNVIEQSNQVNSRATIATW